MKATFLAAMAGLLCAAPASAEMRIFNFTARVDQPAAIVPAGTIVTGSFSYDDALAPTDLIQDGNIAIATYMHPSISFSASFTGFNLSGVDYTSVWDVSAGSTSDEDDSFAIGSFSGQYSFALSIWQPDRAWLTDSGLPTAFPVSLWQGPFADPNDDDGLTVPHGEFTFWDPAQLRGFDAVVLSVTSANLSAVPEPSIWAMMIAGFGLVGAAFRRPKSAARAAIVV